MSRIVTSMRVNRRDTSRIMYNFKTYLWRCPRRGCQSVLSVRDGSFFSGSHLKLNEVVELFYWWTRGHTIFNVFHETGHSSRTIADWFNFHRAVCAQYFINHPIQIGEEQ